MLVTASAHEASQGRSACLIDGRTDGHVALCKMMRGGHACPSTCHSQRASDDVPTPLRNLSTVPGAKDPRTRLLSDPFRSIPIEAHASRTRTVAANRRARSRRKKKAVPGAKDPQAAACQPLRLVARARQRRARRAPPWALGRVSTGVGGEGVRVTCVRMRCLAGDVSGARRGWLGKSRRVAPIL